RLDGERSANEIMAALQAHGWGVAAISVEGKVLSTNQRLKDLLSRSSDLALRRRTLVFVDETMRSSYQELLQSLRAPITDSKRATSTPIKVRVGDGHSVRAVQTGSFGAQIWCLPLDTRAMLLFIPDTDGHSPEQELVDRYNCTPTEAEVAMAMSGGARPDVIAKSRGVNVSTIRGHIKRIYAKVGVKRQADLIVRLRRFG
ncbi:MAG: helix-turn-helix transcriptional regulator, partial [Gammaproteobacteria bacterium]|nr:helix-turn-helix transcriptional regulator [Gammaproteobacteria bacterium]